MRIPRPLLQKYYPIDKYDGTRIFYDWVRSFIRPETVLLNVGAGEFIGRTIRSFRQEVKTVIGVDIDPAVKRNSSLDQAYVVEQGVLPLEDNTVDVAVSDYVFEHVQDPSLFLREVFRVLKDGAPFFFRTPNSFHYTAICSRVMPHFTHGKIASWASGVSDCQVFPTYYRLNSRLAIERTAQRVGFREITLRFVESEPTYLTFGHTPFYMGLAYERLVNKFDALAPLRANIFGRLVK